MLFLFFYTSQWSSEGKLVSLCEGWTIRCRESWFYLFTVAQCLKIQCSISINIELLYFGLLLLFLIGHCTNLCDAVAQGRAFSSNICSWRNDNEVEPGHGECDKTGGSTGRFLQVIENAVEDLFLHFLMHPVSRFEHQWGFKIEQPPDIWNKSPVRLRVGTKRESSVESCNHGEASHNIPPQPKPFTPTLKLGGRARRELGQILVQYPQGNRGLSSVAS